MPIYWSRHIFLSISIFPKKRTLNSQSKASVIFQNFFNGTQVARMFVSATAGVFVFAVKTTVIIALLQ